MNIGELDQYARSMPLWDSLAGLAVRIDDLSVERRELAREEWTRVTTTVLLHGDEATGEGEDVTYAAAEHDSFPSEVMLAGSWSLDDLSRRLDELDLPDFRRWAFESAALDLGLRQRGVSLGEVLGRGYKRVRFVASTRAEIEPYLELDPSLEFKLDARSSWDRPLMEKLASYDRVRVIDLKAYYHGTVVDLAPDPEMYRAVAECFPDAVIEDPWLEDGCLEALAGAEGRLSFDAPVHSLADLDALAVKPHWLNIKPSRFGTVRKLVECIEACQERGIRLYGGGQFELGPGRRQIQRLASLFYAKGPNDVAPSEYNDGGARPGLTHSPLPAPEGIGF